MILTTSAVDHHDHALTARRIWALRDNLTADDAAYVALAELLDARLLTADAKLAHAPGHRANIELIDGWHVDALEKVASTVSGLTTTKPPVLIVISMKGKAVVMRSGRLLASDAIQVRALRVQQSERAVLDAVEVAGNLRLVGGASLPGLFTYGDIDLLLSVASVGFTSTIEIIGRVHTPRRVDLWSEQMALFVVDDDIPVELAVVPTGSSQEAHFLRAWDLLARSEWLRACYNRLKIDAGEDYETRKAEFFERLNLPESRD